MAQAQGSDDAFNRGNDGPGIAKPHSQSLEHSGALDPDRAVAVDQDVRDGASRSSGSTDPFQRAHRQRRRRSPAAPSGASASSSRRAASSSAPRSRGTSDDRSRSTRRSITAMAGSTPCDHARSHRDGPGRRPSRRERMMLTPAPGAARCRRPLAAPAKGLAGRRRALVPKRCTGVSGSTGTTRGERAAGGRESHHDSWPPVHQRVDDLSGCVTVDSAVGQDCHAPPLRAIGLHRRGPSATSCARVASPGYAGPSGSRSTTRAVPAAAASAKRGHGAQDPVLGRPGLQHRHSSTSSFAFEPDRGSSTNVCAGCDRFKGCDRRHRRNRSIAPSRNVPRQARRLHGDAASRLLRSRQDRHRQVIDACVRQAVLQGRLPRASAR